jgi:peptidylamidoglycolate lyase
MRAFAIALVAVLGWGLLSAPAMLQQKPAAMQAKGGEDEFGPYEVVKDWPAKFVTRPGYIWGSQGGVFAETPNKIFLLNKGELKLPNRKLPNNFNGAWGSLLGLGLGNANGPLNDQGESARPSPDDMRNCIVIVDGNGKVIEIWNQWDHLFKGGRGPHTITISPYDPERAVWVVDDLKEQIFKFSNDGKKLLMILGDGGNGVGKEGDPTKLGVEGTDHDHFGRPTNVAFLPDGTFYITDGYVNTRVMKFDKNGKYLLEWGGPRKPGNGPGEFSQLVHSIAIDNNRRVYVADRANARIQVFDENGKFIELWPNIHTPCYIMMSADQHLWVADLEANKMIKYDLNGKYLYGWGTYGTFPGGFYGIHEFSVDSDLNLYTAETFGGRTQKFRPRPGADPSHIAGAPRPLMPKTSS